MRYRGDNMRIWKLFKNLLIGYCVGFTAAYYVCNLTGTPMIDLRHSFFGFICLCVPWILFNVKKNVDKKGAYDYQDGKLVFKEENEDKK